MKNSTLPLVLTPSSRPTESLLGYLLRVSEKNGYKTPWNILEYAGITRREATSVLFPIDRFAKVLGRKPLELHSIAYSKRDENGSLELKLLSHRLGQSARMRTYRLAKSAFCPKCVQEKGYIEAHWDIALVTACPRHACKLLDACPSCGKRISHFRKGLLRCECGQNWSEVECSPVDSELIDLQSILISKVLGKPVAELRNTGMPVQQLEALSLRGLLSAIQIIGKYAVKCNKSDWKNPFAIASAAAMVFSNWPNNYERLINTLINIGGGWKLKHFLAALNRAGLWEGEGSFLRDPIKLSLAVLPPLNPRSLSNSKKSKATSINESPKTKRICQSGRNSIGERKAAAFLNIPVSALNRLRVSGCYKVLNIPKPLTAFHLEDLKRFKDEVLARAPNKLSPVDMHAGIVSLGYVLQEARFHTKSGKGDLIASILSGVLTAVGRTGDEIPDIFLKRTEVDALLIATRTKAEGNTVTQADAAEYLDCDPLTIPGLSSGGYIDSVPRVGSSRITLDSLEKFRKQYVSLSSIANEWETSTRKLMRLCAKNTIPILEIPRQTISVQPFVKREYYDRAIEALKHYQAIATAPPQLSSAMLMRRYLDGLREDGVCLPRRAGVPNKAAIAKGCGFDRNTLYLNNEVKKLLDDFDREDRQRNRAIIRNDGMSELRRYLAELKANKLPLPRLAGKPNKFAIAKAGRFDRKLFYLNQEAMAMVRNFEPKFSSDFSS